MKKIKKEEQIDLLLGLPSSDTVSRLLIDYDTEALEEAYQYLYAKQEKGTLQRAIWRELRLRKGAQLKSKPQKAGWVKKFEKEWEETRMLVRKKAGACSDPEKG